MVELILKKQYLDEQFNILFRNNGEANVNLLDRSELYIILKNIGENKSYIVENPNFVIDTFDHTLFNEGFPPSVFIKRRAINVKNYEFKNIKDLLEWLNLFDKIFIYQIYEVRHTRHILGNDNSTILFRGDVIGWTDQLVKGIHLF